MITQIDKVDGIYLKRNDLYEYGGCYGGKAECVYGLLQRSESNTIVTCGSRDSLQCEIVSKMCEEFGYACHIFMPAGAETKSMTRILSNQHTVLHLVPNGYMVVVKKRAADFAQENGYTFIPFGLQTPYAVHTVAKQVVNVPKEVHRIVVPVGGGITLCGVLQGLVDNARIDVEVLGVLTGGDASKTIKVYKPIFSYIPYRLIPWMDGTPTERYAGKVESSIGDIKLDSVYEAKCKKFLQENDLLWIVGYHEV